MCRRVEQHKRVVFAVKESLTRGGYLETFAVHRARVPIVKFVVPPQHVRPSHYHIAHMRKGKVRLLYRCRQAVGDKLPCGVWPDAMCLVGVSDG